MGAREILTLSRAPIRSLPASGIVAGTESALLSSLLAGVVSEAVLTHTITGTVAGWVGAFLFGHFNLLSGTRLFR